MKKIKLEKIRMNLVEDKKNQSRSGPPFTFECDSSAQLPHLYAIDPSIDQVITMILPTVPVKLYKIGKQEEFAVAAVESPLSPILKLIKTTGIYAISSVAPPLVSLVLAPLLTHHLSPSDYGILIILNLLISLGAGISQLGLPSAFFRAYNYDYNLYSDQRDVLATVTMLLCIVSILMTIGVTILSSFLAQLLFGQSMLGGLVAMAGGVILLQNLTVPGFALLRAESRAFSYSLLSIGNLLITLLGTIVLVVVFHLGIAGSLIANGCGYASVLSYMLPMTLLRSGLKIRTDIARNVLAFGLPLVLNYVSYWMLQLSDRYLLSLFRSLAQTALYAVAYTMGSVISILIITPFTLAWPIVMFNVAKREDATEVFRLLFRWFSLFLLFAAFGLSLLGTVVLDWLFPISYHSSAFIIPIVAISIVLFGLYYIFMTGANVKRKTWLTAVFTTISALVNISLNLILIPLYGSMGAAVSTLLAYIVLVLVAYVINQRIYPIPFETGIFISALLLGIALYSGSGFLAQTQGTFGAWSLSLTALALYSGCLVCFGMWATQSHKNKHTYLQVRKDYAS